MQDFVEQLSIVFNAVAPFFLIMSFGWLAVRLQLVGDKFIAGTNKLVFTCFFPAALFMSMYQADLANAFEPMLVGYFLVTALLVYLLSWVIGARFLPRPVLASFVQAVYRGNYIILAMAVIPLLMGPASLPVTALMVPFVVVTYNIMAAVVFTVNGLAADISGRKRMKEVLLGICKNPVIIGCVLGVVVNLLGVRLPVIVDRSFTSLAAAGPTVAMLALGGVMSAEKVRRNFRVALVAAAAKNLLVPLVFIVPAVFLGFRDIELAVIAMIGLSPVATLTYVTAVELGGDADAAASCLVLSNGLAIFTIVPGLTMLRMLGLL